MKRTYSLIAVTLAVSLVIYLFYRTEKTLVNELVLRLVPRVTFAGLRSCISQAIPLSDPIIFSLPGGLWVFCATALSKDLHMTIGKYKVPIVNTPVLFAAGLETCQLFHLTTGTFDRWDVGFYAAFWWLAYHGFHSGDVRQDPRSPFTFRGFICLACFLSVYLAHVNH